MKNNNLVKPFTITTAGVVAGYLATKAIKALNDKRKNDILKQELEHLHKIQDAEISKTGATSEKTENLIQMTLAKML